MSAAPQTPFHDLDQYLELPRLAGLALSMDGSRLVTGVARLSADTTRYVTHLWQIDPTGVAEPRRLTGSAKGESQPTFTPNGDLVFLSEREDPEDPDAESDQPAALMLLPAGPGEARVIATPPGGFDQIVVARQAGTLVATSPTLPGSADLSHDAERRKERRTHKINAILHDSYPIRYWDHDLGPDQNRLVVSQLPLTASGDQRASLRDLTPAPGRALDEAGLTVSADGMTAVVTWHVGDVGGRRVTLQLIDLNTGQREVLLDDPQREFFSPAISPDGTLVAAVSETLSTHDTPPRFGLVLVAIATGQITELDVPAGAIPSTPVWSPDGTRILITCDQGGRAPVFDIALSDGSITRLTGDDGAYSDLCIAPDGLGAYAVRSAIDSPPRVVRLDPNAADQRPVVLRDPLDAVELPGQLTEVTAQAEDGTALRAWLCLPQESASPAAPLLLWIHGGPLSSWNAWSWRWNPWLMVALGYAVLLPDPALSTGYSDAFIDRGWGRWGQAPFTDLMSLSDATVQRGDIDATRTAAMGGSFGGYMANWIAGHTDRFDAIVTHASLWALDQFGPTTDHYHYWRRELSTQMSLDNSPHLHVDNITTPMLVIHGDKDYRVPVGDGLRLWAELAERHLDNDGITRDRFLLFPDENHWILKPQHTRIWYQTVYAFLDWHVLGGQWHTPDLLR
ncbi:MAG: prolyl oligopeptidase family serine peptidase [Euzebya sp.]